MEESADTPEFLTTDPEMRQLIGMFDVPAFARRGQEMEFALDRLQAKCRREREEMLEMVRLRLRQWSAVATGPADGDDVFAGPIETLVAMVAIEPPSWSARPAPARRRLPIARDLAASVDRFNRRWGRFLAEMNLGPINRMIDHYNRYYILEKECVFGSSRVAARHFQPRRPLTPEALLEDHPLLPAQRLRA
ncbi:MAG: hypothetical protein JWN86_4725 [Planctomycetota bacterium]|nr:hypothetical protein [Planctomycetota bacterium]